MRSIPEGRTAHHVLWVLMTVALISSCAIFSDQPPGTSNGPGFPASGYPVPNASRSATPVAPTPTATVSRPAVRKNFVSRSGRALTLNGHRYTFTGLNIYNATSYDNRGCSYGMGTRASIRRSLDEIGPGQKVIRSWFFQYQATQNGRRDWSTFDAVLSVAKSRGYRVIPVLINQWGDCEGWKPFKAGYKNEAWFRSGYRTTPTSPGMKDTYEQWVREVVTRYRNESAILAWQLVNEAEDASTYDGACSTTASATLTAFAAHLGRLVKSIDPHHLLSLGTIGSGQCGARGSEYLTVHAVPQIDLCEYHDYDDLHAIPGDPWNGLRRRIAQCVYLNKPLFVGEVGLSAAQAGGTLAGRARVIQRKAQGQSKVGVVGMLAWLWRDGKHGGSSLDSYEIGPRDPVLKSLRIS